MTGAETSIVLIGREADTVAESLKSVPGFKVEAHTGTLTEMNGRAQEMAASRDLIIFRTQPETDDDVTAVEGIRKAAEATDILALCDADTKLGDIRKLTRAGVREVLPDTATASEIEEVIRSWKAAARPETAHAAPAGRDGTVVAVAQARGGIGSTLLAVNMADQLLARAGRLRKAATRKVALVDLDLQFGAVGSFVDAAPNPTLYQMAMDGIEPDATYLRQAMTELPSGLHVLTAPEGFAPLDALKKTQIDALLRALKAEYDFVVLDLPRALVDWVSPVLHHADRLMLATDTTVPAIQSARRLIDFYTEDNLSLDIEVVVNHEKKPLISPRHHGEAAKVLERKFRYWLPHDQKAAANAVDCGKPLSQSASRSPLTKAISRMARDLASETASRAAKAAK